MKRRTNKSAWSAHLHAIKGLKKIINKEARYVPSLSDFDGLLNLITNSKYFDEEYYLNNNPDVKQSGMNPLEHYLVHGGREGRNPSEKFDSLYYLSTYADVREASINPLVHFLLWGQKEGRLSRPAPQSSSSIEKFSYKKRQQTIIKQMQQVKSSKSSDFDVLAKKIINKLLDKNNEIIIYPLSYPLDVVQRPQHFFRYMAENNFSTLILEYDYSKAPYIKEVSKNTYVTNLFLESINHLHDEPTILYVTYPFYSFVVELLRPSKLIYDVIDDLDTFSGSSRALQIDHKRLIEASDMVLYSSQELARKDNNLGSKKYIVENGVWPQDFKIDGPVKKYSFKKGKEKVIGYYGAISNILDWDLIAKIANIKGVRLVFIGPKADFVNAGRNHTAKMEYVLGQNSVTYLGPVDYGELPKYASNFDACIIPFLINDITHSVSPLKLFEYMAMGLMVFATPTKTLLEYKESITVASADILPIEIKKWLKSENPKDLVDYSSELVKADWNNKFKPVLLAIGKTVGNKRKKIAKNIDIVSVNFYDQQGGVLFKGGAERYIFDLAQILSGMGHNPRIIQNAQKSFTKVYRGIEVKGIDGGVRGTDGLSMRKMSKSFDKVCGDADLIIASPLDLACEIDQAPVIGINHGIHWDTVHNSLANNRTSDYSEIFEGVSQSICCVCVDTNFINWTRTYDYSLGEKLKYIPNYYDQEEFKKSDKAFDGKLKFLYPRRLYDARGIFITLEAFNYLLDKYDDIELLLVGQATDPSVIKSVKKILNKYPQRVLLEEHEMEDMYKVYGKSHIALVPTRYAEGTSLSCLEAMATNNAIIATNIGGLPNLVVDQYNGLLIEPTAGALIEAAETLIRDRSLTKRLASNGLSLAKVFEKENWDRRWKKLLEEVL